MALSTFGGRVRASRENAGMTQDELRRAAGLSKGFLSDIENDKRNISVDTLCALSDALKVPIEWLLRGCKSKVIQCWLCKGSGKLHF